MSSQDIAIREMCSTLNDESKLQLSFKLYTRSVMVDLFNGKLRFQII